MIALEFSMDRGHESSTYRDVDWIRTGAEERWIGLGHYGIRALDHLQQRTILHTLSMYIGFELDVESSYLII